MKFYGNAHFQQGGTSTTEDTLASDGSAQIQNPVFGSVTTFPVDPRQGQIAFVNSTVFICVSVSGGLPVWVPMTREITAYTHAQGSVATTWNINHNQTISPADHLDLWPRRYWQNLLRSIMEGRRDSAYRRRMPRN